MPPSELAHAAVVLRLEGVDRWFWRGSVRVEVLRGLSLEVAAGELVAVWGRLGSGKTALLRIAASLDRPDDGAVEFAGRPFDALEREELQRVRRHAIGFANRTGPLEPELTALDHVAFPLAGVVGRGDARRRAARVLGELGLDAACADLTWGELTDGERTLVSIAHAVVREPRLLLVDDPTSNLGAHERERTVALLRRFAEEQGMAVLMTAPDMAATLGAHRVFVLSGGALLAAEREPAQEENVVRFPDARA